MASVPAAAPQAAFVSLEERYAQRNATLREWHKQFNTEKQEVINAVAENIFTQIREKLEKVTTDPSFAMYASENPLRVNCEMDARYRKVSSDFKKHLKEGTLLHKFIKKSEDEARALEIEFEKAEKGSSYRAREREHSGLHPNYDLVALWLREVGLAVQESVDNKMNQYKAKPGNQALVYTVQWEEGDGGGTSHFSKGRSYSGVYAQAWVPVEGNELKKPQERKKGFFG